MAGGYRGRFGCGGGRWWDAGCVVLWAPTGARTKGDRRTLLQLWSLARSI